MIVYPSGRVQLSFNERKNAQDEILERSLLINIRSQNADDCIELYQEIKRRLDGNTRQIDKPLITFTDESKEKRICPDCRSALSVRVGRNGPFYGCLGYPRCKHTEKVK